MVAEQGTSGIVWRVLRSIGNGIAKFVMVFFAVLKSLVPGGAPPLPPESMGPSQSRDYRP